MKLAEGLELQQSGDTGPRRELWLAALCAVIIATTLGVDVATPRGVAAGVLPYFLAVLVSAWLPWRWAPFAVAGVATVLSLVGFAVTSGGAFGVILANRLFAIGAIWVTAVLASMRQRSRHTLEEQARTAELRARNEEFEAQVTERVRAEERLRGQEERLRSILETAPDAIVTIDERGIVSSFSPPAERLFGYTAADALGQNVRMLMPPPYREEHDGYIENYLRTGERKIIGLGRQVVAQRQDGSTFPVTLAVNEMFVDGRRMFTGIIRDITEEQKRQDELRQAQRLTAIGELTGGIAHDFNNILTVIMGNQELLETQIEGEDQRHMLQEAQEAAEMGAELTRRLLAFARRQALDPKALDLNGLVTSMRTILERTLGETVTIEPILEDGLDLVLADEGQVENALLNLAINARDAMPHGGRLIIETANWVLDDDYARVHPEVVVGLYVRLAVTDNGVGMTPEIVERALEPFFTTKETGEGTGLGLSMIYGFAKQSGGHLNIYSEIGHGTCVSLYLPVAEPMHETDRVTSESGEQYRGRGEAIFVVEDDARVRRLLIRRLQQMGYVTHEAANGPAALKLVDSLAPIHLLLTDVVMPGGMSGPELAAGVRQRHPATKVLYTSGYPDRSPGTGSFDAGAPMLRKPYDQKTLARKLREVLDA